MKDKHKMNSEIESTNLALAAAKEGFFKHLAEFKKIQSEYAETLQRKKSLAQKSAELQAEIDASKLEFKQEFAAANYERSPAVKKALQRKHDAHTMLEEIDAALSNIDRQIPLLKMDGGPKARVLLSKRSSLEKNFVKLKMLEAIAAIPQEFKNALALAAAYFPEDAEIGFVWRGLMSQAMQTGEKESLPFEPFTVGPFTQQDFEWTGAQIQTAKAALAGGADPDSIKPTRIPNIFYGSS